MEFRVGQKVRVKQYEDMVWDTDDNCTVGGIRFSPEMHGWCGKVVTIRDINSNFVDIKEDSGRWAWAAGMLEPVYNIPEPFFLGCLVRSSCFNLASVKREYNEQSAVCFIIEPKPDISVKIGEEIIMPWGLLTLVIDSEKVSLEDLLGGTQNERNNSC